MTVFTSDPPPSATTPSGIPLLDPNPRRFGPVTRRLLLRLVIALAVVEAIAAVLTFVLATDRARTFGLGLTFPGGGFLYTGHPIAFIVTAALVVLALVLWWGISAHFAIPLVWLGSAFVAWASVDVPRVALDRGTTWDWTIPVVYALPALVAGVMFGKLEHRFRSKRAKVGELNEYLSAVELPEDRAPARDPNAMDAELLRWCYDIAFQPADGLKGLDWGEQFHGGTQLRYQVNSYCWALSAYAANYLPNGKAQIEDALSRMILKHTDLRAWGYWRTLNLLGNFDTNPDPIVRDNIMFSAFLGDVLNMFEAATGSRRFDEPGSLRFVWKDGREFPYDHHKIAAAVLDNFERSNLGFFPCEPGWSFTVCNVMGAQALYGHDTLHGTSMWAGYRDRWRRALEQEYLTPDGSYAHIRSNHVGLSWDTGEFPGGHYNSTGTGGMNEILPGHGKRGTALNRRSAEPSMKAMAAMVKDGILPMELPREPYRHRQGSSPLPNWTKIIGGARLVGAWDLAEAAVAGADKQCATGLRWPDRPLDASAFVIGGFMFVRWSTPLGTADLNQRGYERPVGPTLDRAPWDEVMLVLARSSDGISLDVALQPWDDAPLESVELRFGQLRPGETYVLTGESTDTLITADTAGAGTASVRVDGLTHLRLEVGR